MSLKKIAAGLFWIAVIAIALPMVLRIGSRTWSETKDNPIVHGTSGVVSDWARTALGNTGSGGGFGGFGSSSEDPLQIEKQILRNDEEKGALFRALEEGEVDDQARIQKRRLVQKRLGVFVEWHPRIKWKDVNNATPGAPIAVSIDVYRCDRALVTGDNPAGVSSTVATFLAKRGDPPTSLAGNVNLMDGVQYAFQAYVPNSDIEASTLIGPYTFIKGKGGGWQTPSGRKSFQEDLELLVNK